MLAYTVQFCRLLYNIVQKRRKKCWHIVCNFVDFCTILYKKEEKNVGIQCAILQTFVQYWPNDVHNGRNQQTKRQKPHRCIGQCTYIIYFVIIIIIFDLMLNVRAVAAVFVTDRLTALQNFYRSHNSLQFVPHLTTTQYSFFCLQWDVHWAVLHICIQPQGNTTIKNNCGVRPLCISIQIHSIFLFRTVSGLLKKHRQTDG